MMEKFKACCGICTHGHQAALAVVTPRLLQHPAPSLDSMQLLGLGNRAFDNSDADQPRSSVKTVLQHTAHTN